MPDKAMMAWQLSELGACTQPLAGGELHSAGAWGGSGSLPGFGNSAAATTWGESEGQKQRVEAPSYS